MTADALILIPARAGSTRVKNKNLRLLGGRPLIAHRIESALAGGAGRVVVSTDSEAIAACAREYGAETPFLRPAEISGAQASSLSALLHALQWFHDHENWTPDLTAFCPPSSPFIRAETTAEMFKILRAAPDANACAAVTEPAAHPFTAVRKRADGRLNPGFIEIDGKTARNTERSQDYPKVWQGSPGCRIVRTAFFTGLMRAAGAARLRDVDYHNTYDVDNCLPYFISRFEAVDIDDEFDFFFAEQVYARRMRETPEPQ